MMQYTNIRYISKYYLLQYNIKQYKRIQSPLHQLYPTIHYNLMIRNEYDYLFKFILIGNTNVGKSCMLMRLLENRFRNQHQPTLGVQFGSKMYTIKDKHIKLQIWDTAGQQSFKSITRAYYKGSIAAILVFDLTNEKSFQDLSSWLFQVRNHSHQKINIVLVGNKKDLTKQREVSQEKIQKFVKQNKFMEYYEISALSGQNVQKPFKDLINEVNRKIQSGLINLQTDSGYGVKVGPKIKTKYSSQTIDLIKDKQKLQEKKRCNC